MNKIIELLEQLQEVHSALLDIGRQKQQAIIQNHIQELTKWTAQESRLQQQAADLDSQREAVTSAILENYGLPANTRMSVIHLAKISSKADEKQALLDARQRLLTTVQQLKEQNDLNRQLAEQSLQFIAYSLDLMSAGPEDDAVYHQQGRPSRQGYSRRFFDTRA